MAGLTFHKCEVLSDPLIREYYGDEAANFGEYAAKVCGNLSSPVNYGTKQCDGFTTPPLTWYSFSVLSQELPAHYSASIDMWFGYEEPSSGGFCLWVGLNAGEGSKICAKSACFDSKEISYDAIISLVRSFIDDLHDEATSGSNVDLILKVAIGLVVAIVGIVIAYIIVDTFGAAAIVGVVTEAAISGATLVGKYLPEAPKVIPQV